MCENVAVDRSWVRDARVILPPAGAASLWERKFWETINTELSECMSEFEVTVMQLPYTA